MNHERTAVLWRMHTDSHICPYGLKSKELLETEGFRVEDRLLTNRSETDAFKRQHDVKTTPQAWIGEQRVGGYEDLRQHFGKQASDEKGSRYRPVIAIFATCFVAAFGLAWSFNNTIWHAQTLFYFVALTMLVLAIKKLMDLESFSNQFITYDLLAMRHIRYSYVYPFAKAYTGIGMLAKFNPWLVAPVGIFIGTVGAVSVYKAVYLDKRDLKCACIGGGADVPLGSISLTENLFMVGAGLAMIWRWF